MDRTQIQFDFAVCEDSSFPQRAELERLGSQIYLLPKITSLVKYIAEFKRIVRCGHYRIVHCHMSTLSVFPLYAAWRGGAGVRICHNHTTAYRGEGIKALAKYLLRPFCLVFATDYFACSEYAGRWMFGRKAVKSGRVYVMRNGLDTMRFRYDSAVRERRRAELGVEEKFVVGNVGRFVYQKNHIFLIDIFNELHKIKKDAVLLMVGEGELQNQIRKRVEELGLSACVIFYGTSNGVSELYQAMDVFCLPSYFEGLPVVTIEAQTAGLPCIVSYATSEEAVVLGNCRRLALQQGAKAWVKEILCASGGERSEAAEKIKGSGYSVQEGVKKLTVKYKNLYEVASIKAWEKEAEWRR
ncbi:MAG: glycosyltransferase family 1 protein [Blautia sp.]|nr:glycosyltransferase family 1 protein [Blautia sp.]